MKLRCTPHILQIHKLINLRSSSMPNKFINKSPSSLSYLLHLLCFISQKMNNCKRTIEKDKPVYMFHAKNLITQRKTLSFSNHPKNIITNAVTSKMQDSHVKPKAFIHFLSNKERGPKRKVSFEIKQLSKCSKVEFQH